MGLQRYKDSISFPNSCRNLRVAYYSDFGNFSSDYISGKFPKCLGIWEISEIEIWGIPQISLLPIGVWVHLKDFGNFPNRFPKIEK